MKYVRQNIIPAPHTFSSVALKIPYVWSTVLYGGMQICNGAWYTVGKVHMGMLFISVVYCII